MVIPTSKTTQQLLETAAGEDEESEVEVKKGGGGFGGLLGKLKKPTISPMDDGSEMPKLELLVEEGGADGGAGVGNDAKSNNDLEKLEEGQGEEKPKKKKMMFRRDSQLASVMGEQKEKKEKKGDGGDDWNV